MSNSSGSIVSAIKSMLSIRLYAGIILQSVYYEIELDDPTLSSVVVALVSQVPTFAMLVLLK
jgi:hypothetical protein